LEFFIAIVYEKLEAFLVIASVKLYHRGVTNKQYNNDVLLLLYNSICL